MSGRPDPRPASTAKQRRTESDQIASERFKRTVHAIDRECVMAGISDCEGYLRAHHVVYQQHLRKAGRAELLFDPSNGVVVCERHHRRHHGRFEPIPARVLPERCVRFAAEYGFADVLARFYADA